MPKPSEVPHDARPCADHRCALSPVLARAPALPLPSARPEAIGLSRERLNRIGDYLRTEISKKTFPGASILVARRGGAAYFETFGEGLAKKSYVEKDVFAGHFDNAEFAERIAALPLAYQPGTTWDYSHSTDILGRVIEVVLGKSLLAALKERIFTPLGMNQTSFTGPEADRQALIAEPFGNDRVIGAGAMVNDPRQSHRWESGGGGLVSTIGDYARFCQMVMNKGQLGGKRILGPLNWSGAAGTAFWLDPQEDMFTVLMVQTPKNRGRLRPMIRNLVYASLIR